MDIKRAVLCFAIGAQFILSQNVAQGQTAEFPRELLGVWGASLAICQKPDDAGDRAPTEISARRIVFYESTCSLARITRGLQPQAWHSELRCEGEGEKWTDFITFVVTENRRLAMLSTRDSQTTLVSCRRR